MGGYCTLFGGWWWLSTVIIPAVLGFGSGFFWARWFRRRG